MLKSPLFRSFDLDDESGKVFRQDVERIARLDSAALRVILNDLVSVRTATTEHEKLRLLERIANTAELTLVEVVHACRPLIFFLDAFVRDPQENNVEALVEDMMTLEL